MRLTSYATPVSAFVQYLLTRWEYIHATVPVQFVDKLGHLQINLTIEKTNVLEFQDSYAGQADLIV